MRAIFFLLILSAYLLALTPAHADAIVSSKWLRWLHQRRAPILKDATIDASILIRKDLLQVGVADNMTNCEICLLMVSLGVVEAYAAPNNLTATNYTTAVTGSNVLYQICQLSIFQTGNAANVTCASQVLTYNATVAQYIFYSQFPPPAIPGAVCARTGRCT